MTFGIILLAAGQGRRFGADKRQVRLDDGQPLIIHTIRQLSTSKLPVYVVLHPGDQILGQQLSQLGVEWGICPDANLGMGHSLAFGVHANQCWDGWLIALADMPWIQPDTVRTIVDALENYPIVVPMTADGQRGHPVGFQRQLGFDLMQSQGDQGARHVLQQHSDDVCRLVLDDDGIIRDVDRPEDLTRI